MTGGVAKSQVTAGWLAVTTNLTVTRIGRTTNRGRYVELRSGDDLVRLYLHDTLELTLDLNFPELED